MRPRRLLVTLSLFIIAAVCLLAWLAAPAVPESMPPTVTVSDPAPTLSATPVLGHPWALGWRAHAVKNRKPLPRLAYCLGISGPAKVPARPSLAASPRAWQRFGARCKSLAYSYVRLRQTWRQRVLHPVVVSAASWRPLALWVGWPKSSLATLVIVIRGESGGVPTARNGSFVGLMQIWCEHAPWADLTNPLTNLAVGLQLWRRSGWAPWAATAP